MPTTDAHHAPGGFNCSRHPCQTICHISGGIRPVTIVTTAAGQAASASQPSCQGRLMPNESAHTSASAGTAVLCLARGA